MAVERARVLVVDDDADVRGLIALNLRLAGLDPVEAADGPAALAALAGGGIAAVLLDQTMPGMTGLDVLARIRGSASTGTLPVILVTGRGGVADRVRGLDAGATDYVVKPVAPEELVARVKAHLRGQATWRAHIAARQRERAALTAALGELRSDAATEELAASICAEVGRLDGVAGAAVVVFTAGAGAVVLAGTGTWLPDLAPGHPLPAPAGRALHGTADRGPWVAAADPAHAPLSGPGGRGGAQPVACAPLRTKGGLLGVLALACATDVAQPDGQVAQTLSTAIDAAAVASGLLAGHLGDEALRAARARLARVVAERAFAPVFQPIVDLRRAEPVGYELLTRFADGTPPAERFAEAALLGLSDDLEAATLDRGLAAARTLPGDGFTSVNVSAAFVGSAGLAEVARGWAAPLVLEITEHERVEDYPALRRAVDRLGDHVRLSVDDTGAGYASLQHILALEPEFVKLDRSWIAGIDTDPARQALVAGLASFAARTGCRLVAEGIETRAELATVTDLAVELGQGYLLGRPAPAPELHTRGG